MNYLRSPTLILNSKTSPKCRIYSISCKTPNLCSTQYRGRKRLRYVLYETAISLIGKNAELRAIHEYYRTRKETPLKKMQSVAAVACKGLRIFYTILTKGVDYDAGKLMGDIRRPRFQAA